MTRALILAVQVPFVQGGAERLVEQLQQQIIARGHYAEVLRLPFKWYPYDQLLREAAIWRSLVLADDGPQGFDVVIPTRFPTYLVQHPRKVVWLLHQHRQVYDLLNTPLTDVADTAENDQLRRVLYELDNAYLPQCSRLFTISRRVTERLTRYNGIASEPLYHPPPLAGRLREGRFDGYILSVGRIELTKRIDLLVRAMAHVPPPARAVVVGRGPQLQAVQELAGSVGVADRIAFLGYQDDEQVVELYANCSAVFFAPVDEDLGYITLEAFLAGKPVVGCTDSGAVLEFLRDGATGFVVPPEPEPLANALSRLASDTGLARALGTAGKASIAGISWAVAVEALVG